MTEDRPGSLEAIKRGALLGVLGVAGVLALQFLRGPLWRLITGASAGTGVEALRHSIMVPWPYISAGCILLLLVVAFPPRRAAGGLLLVGVLVAVFDIICGIVLWGVAQAP